MDERQLAAFKGLLCPERPGYEDVAGVLAHYSAMEDGYVELTWTELDAIAERILELSNIVAQNALVAIPEGSDTMLEPDTFLPAHRPVIAPEREEQIAAARSRATKQEGSIL